VSPQIETFTGYSPAQWSSDPALWVRTLHPEDRDSVLTALTRTRLESEPFLAEYRVQCQNGAIVWLRSEGRWSTGEGGRRLLQGFIVDISDRRRAEETIHHLAFHDGLTGLANGGRLRNELSRAIEQARSVNRPVAVLRLCVRRLREINSTLGRDNGDRIIQKVAKRLESREQAQLVARLGAAEFAVILSGADAAGGRRIADRCVVLLQEPIVIEGLPVEIDACVGIAMYPGHGEEAETLLRRADVALDHARRSSIGAALNSKSDDPYDPRRLVVMGELRRAIETDQLRLEYQPKIDLKSRDVVGVEALLR
jgi:diguanylate cyclase (GGDEF)-like protein/PAS domain S-box-containing protein